MPQMQYKLAAFCDAVLLHGTKEIAHVRRIKAISDINANMCYGGQRANA